MENTNWKRKSLPLWRFWVLGAFVLVKFILQYTLTDPVYELQRDEFLHLDLGKHLAWGYLSVPPFTSWVAWLINALGNSVFWVKFFPALFGALTLVLVWSAIEALGGDMFALVLGAMGITLSVLLRLNLLFQPNSADVLYWTAFYYVAIRYLADEKAKWLMVGAVVLAFGFLNKYNVVFQLMGIVPAFLVTAKRHLFLRKEVIGVGALGLALVSGNLWWQYANGFPVVHHLSELSERQLVHVKPADFLKSQLFFFAGSLPVIVAGLTGFFVYRPFRVYRPFFWAFFFTIAIFIFFRAKDYYAIGLYPIYIAFGSVAWSAFSRSSFWRILRPIGLLLPILVFAKMYQVVFPNKSPAYIAANPDKYRAFGLLRWEDGKDHTIPQDFADMLGWKELARKVDDAFADLNAPGETLVLCDNYGQAGAINFYSRRGIQAVSFNADYLNWFVTDRPYRHLIRVKNKGSQAEELATTAPFFNEARIADSIANPFAREHGTIIFSFRDARIDISKRIEEEIRDRKSEISPRYL